MSISSNPEYSDVLEDVAVWTTVSVSTTPVELKVGATPEQLRERIRIYNNGPQRIYLGFSTNVTASGVNKGETLFKDQVIEYAFGPTLTIYAVTESGSSTVMVAELG